MALWDKMETPAQRQRALSLFRLSSEEGKNALPSLLISANGNFSMAPITHEHAINRKLPAPPTWPVSQFSLSFETIVDILSGELYVLILRKIGSPGGGHIGLEPQSCGGRARRAVVSY